MGLGIIEPRGRGKVPGTVNILEGESTDLQELGAQGHNTGNTKLKYRDGFLLVPQPSDDPNDPLNWPLWKRDGILVVLCLMAVVTTTLSPILAATSFSLLSVFPVQFGDIALLTGYNLLGVGVGGLFFVPSARVWGKRHLYLLGTVIVIVCSVWGGLAGQRQQYKSFLWARIFQGVGLAPFEALVNASVGDLFFVHERGKRMALTTICLFGSAFLAPAIVGVIATTQGFQWSFYWVAILSGILLPLVFFCAPETAFVRSAALNNDFGDGDTFEKQEFSGTAIPHHEHHHQHKRSTSGSHAHATTKYPKEGAAATASVAAAAGDAEGSSSSPASSVTVPRKTPYLKTLLPFNGRKTEESYVKLFFRPFPLFLQPGVVWVCVTQGVMIGWTVFIGIILSTIFSLPPLFFDQKQVGYLFFAAFVGALGGFLVCGLAADPLAKYLTKRNNGVFEPEFRVPLVLFQFFFGTIGLFGFAVTANDIPRYGWPGPAVFFGFVLAGMVCGAVASALYLVDAHREIAIEAFTCMIIFKNIFSFSLTFRGYDWLQESGARVVFLSVGGVQIALCSTAILMYIFGKCNRSFWARHDILAFFRLR